MLGTLEYEECGKMNNAEVFIEKYKELERVVRETYHLKQEDSISYYLTHQEKYRKYKADIQYCQDIRNWLQHERKVNSEFAILPNEAIIGFIDSLISKIEGRKRCSDIAIWEKDIYWRSLDDRVKDAMQEMRKRTYTHVPILDSDRRVIGVFDENSVFDCLADAGIVDIDDALRFETIQKYLSVSGREMEEFIFMKAAEYVDELEDRVEQAFRKGKRVGMAFLTADGRQTSPLFGIVTPWDIIAADRD